MKPPAELSRLLADWRRLTELEWLAILQDRWAELARHQQDKAMLRPHLAQALASARAGRPAGAGADPMAATGRELIALQSRNSEALHAKCETRRAELQGLHQTIRNLQGVRRAYGGLPGHAWQSYS